MSQEAMKLALNKAFQLGQRYWSWADSEYSSHWKKADAAKAEFDQLVQDTINAALAEQPAQQQEPVQTTPNFEQMKQILDNIDRCHHKESRHEFLRTWIRDWTIHKLTKHTAPPAQPQQEPVALGALAKRRIFDYIRGAYDLGYNDARNAKAIPGDSAPGYKGRDVEADHGSALLHALEAITSPPAQRTWVGLTDEEIESINVRLAGNRDLARLFARAIEAAHGIKGDA